MYILSDEICIVGIFDYVKKINEFLGLVSCGPMTNEGSMSFEHRGEITHRVVNKPIYDFNP